MVFLYIKCTVLYCMTYHLKPKSVGGIITIAQKQHYRLTEIIYWIHMTCSPVLSMGIQSALLGCDRKLGQHWWSMHYTVHRYHKSAIRHSCIDREDVALVLRPVAVSFGPHHWVNDSEEQPVLSITSGLVWSFLGWRRAAFYSWIFPYSMETPESTLASLDTMAATQGLGLGCPSK